MPKFVWDQIGEKFYETGVDRAAMYLMENGSYSQGFAWNGVTAVNEAPEGAEPTDMYADNVKYLTLTSAENFKFTIEAYTYPDEFGACDGSDEVATGVYIGQQNRKAFGFTYRTLVGNDEDGQDHGYKIHLVYGCLASPSSRDHATVNDSPEAVTLSWSVSTTPVPVTGKKPAAHVIIDSRTADPDKLAAFEKTLYGDETTEPSLPMPDEVISAFLAS